MFRTTLLLTALTALFLFCGYAIGGQTGMILSLFLAGAGNILAYWNSDRLILSMHGAKKLDRRHHAGLLDLVTRLATRAGLPTPKTYLIETDQPNAFATGRNPDNAAIAVTRGLLNTMTEQELAAVIAHELAHIQNRDTLIMTVAATIGGAISALGMIGFLFGGRRGGSLGGIGALLVMILAPLAASIVQMALSRRREYEADRRGAEICGNPLWLVSALETLDSRTRQTINRQAETHPATAPLFIINPLTGGGVDHLFSTHPSTAHRVAALRGLGGNGLPVTPRLPHSSSSKRPSSSRIPVSHTLAAKENRIGGTSPAGNSRKSSSKTRSRLPKTGRPPGNLS